MDAFRGEMVGVTGSVTLQQGVGFELAQVVAELVQAIGAVGEVISRAGLMVRIRFPPAASHQRTVRMPGNSVSEGRWPRMVAGLTFERLLGVA